MKSLSILIPTYNRANQLLRLLNSINFELNKIGGWDKVNVIVRDNTIGDETKKALESSELAAKPWLDYKKNAHNLGFDNNILNLFYEAKGEYVWFIGDDDIIFEDSISKVLELIELNPDILHLPFKQPQDLTVPQYQTSPPIKYWKDITGAVEQVLKNIKITSFVLKKGSTKVDKEQLSNVYSKTGWMHIILAFEVLLNSQNVCTISISEFLAGSKDKEWQVIEWTPSAYLTSKTFYKHDIFRKFDLNKQIKNFENLLYLNGIDMTLFVTTGVWRTNVPITEYIDFGSKYPFRSLLINYPAFLVKFFIIKFRLSNLFKSVVKKYQKFNYG